MTVRLFLTPTRRILLTAVHAGTVARYGDGHDYVDGWRRCTAAMSLMAHAGWVELADPVPTKRPWRLTEAGKAVLGG